MRFLHGTSFAIIYCRSSAMFYEHPECFLLLQKWQIESAVSSFWRIEFEFFDYETLPVKAKGESKKLANFRKILKLLNFEISRNLNAGRTSEFANSTKVQTLNRFLWSTTIWKVFTENATKLATLRYRHPIPILEKGNREDPGTSRSPLSKQLERNCVPAYYEHSYYEHITNNSTSPYLRPFSENPRTKLGHQLRYSSVLLCFASLDTLRNATFLLFMTSASSLLRICINSPVPAFFRWNSETTCYFSAFRKSIAHLLAVWFLLQAFGPSAKAECCAKSNRNSFKI